jgi:aminopeptidase C
MRELTNLGLFFFCDGPQSSRKDNGILRLTVFEYSSKLIVVTRFNALGMLTTEKSKS